MKHNNQSKEKPHFLAVLIIVAFLGALVVTGFMAITTYKSFTYMKPDGAAHHRATPEIQLQAILHYATSRLVPQQSVSEITVTFNVLKSLAPCNFLVFGLGHDSLMWASLNPGGTTLFLEEDPKWAHKILLRAPNLRIHTVMYRTRLSDADNLLLTYKFEPQCLPANVRLKGNKRCKLALGELPDAVYEKEWDMVMIDAPRGYFQQAPGRMSAIFSAAVMARARTRRPGLTHVFLHDVNRKVEKVFAEEFLCLKYLVKAVGRLWHFEIPPARVNNGSRFC
ncbi:Polysacc_synt_4 domain-containing protein [Cephalotus follicularis]|uniref:Polysacc_synt_4 domain-containing protein n=1 Tax=Cephalotus follicularis TaxID=3775 RepID=A0A1Q3B8E7_CEPFO|nr:Polysacc_synt_4 domain-containing protein [Cephalotus follicularis]